MSFAASEWESQVHLDSKVDSLLTNAPPPQPPQSLFFVIGVKDLV